jgi:dihydroflavonol-4-reductase
VKKILVTGGTGFLGEHVCREAVARGYAVRNLSRSRSDVLDDLGVESIRGDVNGEGPALAQALGGVSAVIHVAGVVSRAPEDGQRMMRLHVDGTRKVLDAMHKAGVTRIVVASTSGTVAVAKDPQILDESFDYATELEARWPYYASKIFQEKLAFSHGAKLGLEVIAVNPSLLLGPGDRRLSSTGDVQRFLRGGVQVVPKGGLSLVDVRDAAAATVAAVERGRPGERYLMGGANWTFAEFFGRLERVAKVRSLRVSLPPKITRWGASVIEHVYRSRGKEPPVDRMSAEFAEHYWWFDSGKAERELGFEARDPSLTLHDTVDYLRSGIAGDL